MGLFTRSRTRRTGALCGLVVAAVLVSLLMAGSAQAQSASRKAGRGLAGMTTMFLEVPGNIYQETHRKGAAWGWTLGLAQGLGKMVTRTLVGVYELVTCPLEVPADFEPILEPEYPWGYFDDA